MAVSRMTNGPYPQSTKTYANAETAVTRYSAPKSAGPSSRPIAALRMVVSTVVTTWPKARFTVLRAIPPRRARAGAGWLASLDIAELMIALVSGIGDRACRSAA